MKRISCKFLGGVFIFSMVCSVHVKAAELSPVTNGCTEEGINYEVYGEQAYPDATTMPVTRYVTYKGNVTPPKQLPWQETKDGIKYSGTLTRSSYVYIRKDATYTGILTYYLNQ